MQQGQRVLAKRFLADHFLLTNWDDGDLDRLVGVATSRRNGGKEPVFFRGDDGSALLLVLSGRIKIGLTTESGREIVLNTLSAGDLFGEIAMIDGGERSADAVTMEKSELLVIPRTAFLGLIERNSELAIKLLSLLCGHLRESNRLIEDTLFLPLPGRLAKVLFRLGAKHGRQDGARLVITLKISQQELANMIGASREKVNKQMNAWRDDGLITFGGDRIVIADTESFAMLEKLYE